MTRRNPDQSRALSAMRELMAKPAKSPWPEGVLVDHAAEVLGGDEQAKLTAQRVYDQHFRVMGPA